MARVTTEDCVTEIPNPGSNQSITALFVLEVQ